MDDRAVAEIVRGAREMSNNALRTVAQHDTTGTTIVYIRDDVREQMDQPLTDQQLHEWWSMATRTHLGEGQSDRGDLNAVVELFDEAVLVHVRLPATEPVAVTLSFETVVASQLDEFVSKCVTWFETHC